MKDTYYFSHDYNSRTDEKIKRLIRKHGMAGYGLYWAIIEDLYNNANALQLDYDGIAYELRSDEQTIESVINDFDLFVVSGDSFGSKSVQRRLDERDARSDKARRSANIMWDKKRKKEANAERTHSDSNAIKESKGKEKKERIDEKKLLDLYNNLLGRSSRVVSKKVKQQINARLKDGYTKDDIVKALENASKDTYHIDTNYKYLTLEFITRADKLDRFLNINNFKKQSKPVI